VAATERVSPFALRNHNRSDEVSQSEASANGDITRRVLIVEDESAIRESLSELFETEGNSVRAVATLAEALRVLTREVFDLIVTDIRLNGKVNGGLQVMGAAGMLSPDATVIALTAYPKGGNREASHRLGATHFLEKPADLLTLAALAGERGIRTALN
jgi:CheY-like chemotaxis protein